MRKEKGINTKRHRIYFNKVFLPFIHQKIEDFRGQKEGESISNIIMAIILNDGNVKQIEYIVNEKLLYVYIYNFMIANKQNLVRL